jgi:hypothetical protein
MSKRPCTCDRCDQTPGAAYTLEQCRRCFLFYHDDAANRAWGGPGLHGQPRRLPCQFRGAATGNMVSCPACKGSVQLKTFACSRHGSCTPVKKAPGTACCADCADYEPDTYSLVAPLGTRDQSLRWEGRSPRRPWQYRVTCILPHLGALDLLETCVGLLRCQTEPVYLVVVDTGSPPALCQDLEKLRDVDLEIHYVRGNGYTHSSEPVAVALDLGMARVNTEYIFLTHEDVFLKRRDTVSWLVGQCSAECPAVGWEMSPRPAAAGQWRGMVSHTCTVLHAPTMRRIGASWHMQRGRDLLGLGADYRANGWPDTETALNLVLRAQGVVPKLLGPEPNYTRHQTDHFDHARSLPGQRIYSPGSAFHRVAESYGSQALAEARQRLQKWQSVQ